MAKAEYLVHSGLWLTVLEKLLLKVMHYSIALLPKKSNLLQYLVTFYAVKTLGNKMGLDTFVLFSI